MTEEQDEAQSSPELGFFNFFHGEHHVEVMELVLDYMVNDPISLGWLECVCRYMRRRIQARLLRLDESSKPPLRGLGSALGLSERSRLIHQLGRTGVWSIIAEYYYVVMRQVARGVPLDDLIPGLTPPQIERGVLKEAFRGTLRRHKLLTNPTLELIHAEEKRCYRAFRSYYEPHQGGGEGKLNRVLAIQRYLILLKKDLFPSKKRQKPFSKSSQHKSRKTRRQQFETTYSNVSLNPFWPKSVSNRVDQILSFLVYSMVYTPWLFPLHAALLVLIPFVVLLGPFLLL